VAVDTRELLNRARKRAQGGILGYCERADWYSTLEADEREELRAKVLSCLGAYHDSVLDVMGALDGTGPLNQRALELLGEIHGLLVRQEHPLGA
jgi:hypothetical protein